MKLKNFRSSKFVILTLSFVAAIFACCFTIAFSSNALASPSNDEFHPITLKAHDVLLWENAMEGEPEYYETFCVLKDTENNHWSNLVIKTFMSVIEGEKNICTEITFKLNDGSDKKYYARYIDSNKINDETRELYIFCNEDRIVSLYGEDESTFTSKSEFNCTVQGTSNNGGVFVDFTYGSLSQNGHVEFSDLPEVQVESNHFGDNTFLSLNSDNGIAFNNDYSNLNYLAAANTGYEFDGWYYITQEDGQEPSAPEKLEQGSSINLHDFDTDIWVTNVYPTFKPVAPTTYSVTFNVLNPEEGKIVDSAGTEVSKIEVNANSAVTVSENTITFADATANASQTYTAVANDGYEFESWGEVPATISEATIIAPSFKAAEPQPTPDPENPGTGGSEENANETVQTGDYLVTVLCGLGFIAAAAGIALIIRKRKLN